MGKVTVDEVRRDVTTFIVDNFLFGNTADAPKPETSFMETSLIDSTGILELVAHLESAYGVSVADEELVPENLDSVANIAAFVVRKKGG
jgi:acyl carrier protein